MNCGGGMYNYSSVVCAPESILQSLSVVDMTSSGRDRSVKTVAFPFCKGQRQKVLH